MKPDFSFEDAAQGPVCGIDEVGRGPLSGPVIACAVRLPRQLPDALRFGLDDSKKLSKAKRDGLFERLQSVAAIGIGRAEVAEIDSINILQATLLAMQRAFAQLPGSDHIQTALVDGNQRPKLPCMVQTIVKGDSRSLSIAAASVVAKVTRDREMVALAEAHPGYGWDRNAGYGTAEHLAALDRLGVTPHHRRSFAPVTQRLAQD